jgi:hypothetical protein
MPGTYFLHFLTLRLTPPPQDVLGQIIPPSLGPPPDPCVQIALYSFPVLWVGLLIISFIKLNLSCVCFSSYSSHRSVTLPSFVPITILALVFNVTNAVGFTYADRDAKQKWASGMAWNMGMSGIGGQLFSGVVKSGVGKVFGSR